MAGKREHPQEEEEITAMLSKQREPACMVPGCINPAEVVCAVCRAMPFCNAHAVTALPEHVESCRARQIAAAARGELVVPAAVADAESEACLLDKMHQTMIVSFTRLSSLPLPVDFIVSTLSLLIDAQVDIPRLMTDALGEHFKTNNWPLFFCACHMRQVGTANWLLSHLEMGMSVSNSIYFYTEEFSKDVWKVVGCDNADLLVHFYAVFPGVTRGTLAMLQYASIHFTSLVVARQYVLKELMKGAAVLGKQHSLEWTLNIIQTTMFRENGATGELNFIDAAMADNESQLSLHDWKWTIVEVAEMAANAHEIATLRMLLAAFPRVITTNPSNMSSLDISENWRSAPGYLLQCAARFNDVQLIAWLYERITLDDELKNAAIWVGALESGNLTLFQQYFPPDRMMTRRERKDLVGIAATNGQVGMLEYLRAWAENLCPFAAAVATLSGHIPVIQWCLERMEREQQTLKLEGAFQEALYCENIAMLDFCVSMRAQIPLEIEASLVIAEILKGKFRSAKWLLEIPDIRMQVNSYKMRSAIIVILVSKGRLAFLRWFARSFNIYADPAFVVQDQLPDPPMTFTESPALCWLFSNFLLAPELERHMVSDALMTDDVRLLRFVLDHGRPLYVKADLHRIALEQGHQSLADWIDAYPVRPVAS